jgi:hypothetical protein
VSRVVAAFAALGILWIAMPPAAASSDPAQLVCARSGQGPPGTQFRVSGQPVGAFVGGWRVSGWQASLCLRGAGAVGASIVATWTTPWGHRYGFDAENEFENLDPLAAVDYRMDVRVRVRGGGWTSWSGVAGQSKPPLDAQGWGFGEAMGFACSGTCSPPPAMRWEYRLTVSFSAPAALDFRGDLRVTK